MTSKANNSCSEAMRVAQYTGYVLAGPLVGLARLVSAAVSAIFDKISLFMLNQHAKQGMQAQKQEKFEDTKDKLEDAAKTQKRKEDLTVRAQKRADKAEKWGIKGFEVSATSEKPSMLKKAGDALVNAGRAVGQAASDTGEAMLDGLTGGVKQASNIWTGSKKSTELQDNLGRATRQAKRGLLELLPFGALYYAYHEVDNTKVDSFGAKEWKDMNGLQ